MALNPPLMTAYHMKYGVPNFEILKTIRFLLKYESW